MIGLTLVLPVPLFQFSIKYALHFKIYFMLYVFIDVNCTLFHCQTLKDFYSFTNSITQSVALEKPLIEFDDRRKKVPNNFSLDTLAFLFVYVIC